MTPSEAERIAAVETLVRGAKDERANLGASVRRMGSRVGSLEERVGMLVRETHARRREARKRAAAVELRLQILTLVVVTAGVIVPIALTILGSH